MPTLLALGAHYDDCIFGVPGIMLKAIRSGYRVVMLSMIGDYSNWAPARDRSAQLRDGTAALCRDYGAEMKFLDFRSHCFEVDQRTKEAVATVVAEVQPDVALLLWGQDRHGDHVVASRLSEVALRHAGSVLNRAVRIPRRLYAYDNGPRHTLGFVPDTFVDVADVWPQAMEWLGRLMALVRDESYRPDTLDQSQRLKQTLAAYRGATCGVSYAEAVCSQGHYTQEITSRLR